MSDEETYAPNQQNVRGDGSGPAEEGDGGSPPVEGQGGTPDEVTPLPVEPEVEREPEPEPEVEHKSAPRSRGARS